MGYHENALVFVEVKYRSTGRTGIPEEAVTYRKQKRICRTADYYRMLHDYPLDRQVRYDVIGISGEEKDVRVKWYRNAFPHIW